MRGVENEMTKRLGFAGAIDDMVAERDAEIARLNEQLTLYEQRNVKLKLALQPFAELYRERMLEDTPVKATNGMCRVAKEAMS